MTTRTIALALALTACSGSSEPTAAVTPEPPPTATAPTSTPVPAPQPEAPIVPEVVPADRTYQVLVLPDQVALETVPVRTVRRTFAGDEYEYGEMTMAWDTVRHPDPAIGTLVSAWTRDAAERLAGEGRQTSEVRCSLELATTSAYSMLCLSLISGDRGGDWYDVHTSMARVENGALVPFTTEDAIVPRNAVRELVAERCHRRYQRDVERGEDDGYGDPCGTGARMPSLVPTNAGLRAYYERENAIEPLEVTIAWSDLDDLVRADGPLASFLPSSGTHDVVVTGSEQLEASLALDCHAHFFVSRVRPIAETMALARGAGATEGEDALLVRETAEGARLALDRCVRTADEARQLAQRAAALATRIGERAETVADLYGARVSWLRVARSIALRDAPRDGAWRATLPPGLLVPAMLGQVGERQSNVGYQGTWARVFPSDARDGWSAGRYLSATTRIPPPAASLLANVPEAQRAAAARDAMIGDLAPPGSPQPLWFVVASTPEPAVYVGVAQGTAEGGPPAAAPALSRAAGTLDEVAFVRQPEDAPQAYVLLGTRIVGAAEGIVHWQLFAPGAAEAGWTLDAPTAASVAESARATYATSQLRDHHVWLVDFTLPDRSHVRVREDGGRFVTE